MKQIKKSTPHHSARWWRWWYQKRSAFTWRPITRIASYVYRTNTRCLRVVVRRNVGQRSKHFNLDDSNKNQEISNNNDKQPTILPSATKILLTLSMLSPKVRKPREKETNQKITANSLEYNGCYYYSFLLLCLRQNEKNQRRRRRHRWSQWHGESVKKNMKNYARVTMGPTIPHIHTQTLIDENETEQ